MGQVVENLQAHFDDFVAFTVLDIHDEADSAGIVLVAGIVETLFCGVPRGSHKRSAFPYLIETLMITRLAAICQAGIPRFGSVLRRFPTGFPNGGAIIPGLVYILGFLVYVALYSGLNSDTLARFPECVYGFFSVL
jgi:hypothetical protein